MNKKLIFYCYFQLILIKIIGKDKRIEIMAVTCRQLIIMLLLLGCLNDWRTLANNSRPLRNTDIVDMADALKYLQDLDTYYADKARVR